MNLISLKRVVMLTYSSKGVTLMETLVSIGIASLVGLGMASMVASQNKEVSGLTEKLAIKDLETRLQKSIAVDDFCSCLFRGSKVVAGSLTSPPSQIPIGYTQPIPNVPTACTAVSSNTKLIPASGQTIAGSQIKVSTLNYSNLTLIGPNQYSGQLNISFDPKSGVRSLKGIKASFVLTFNASGDFINCGPAKNLGSIATAYRGGGFTVTVPETGLYQVDFIGSVRANREAESYIWMIMNGGRNPMNPTESRCGHRDAGSSGNTFVSCPFHMTEFWNLVGGSTYNFGYGGSFPGGGYLNGGGPSDALWVIRKR